MQKNLSPAPVMTSTRVRVSRRTSLMQSRISWHICAVNMLPSSGRLSVSQPIGPSSLYKMVSNAMTGVTFQKWEWRRHAASAGHTRILNHPVCANSSLLAGGDAERRDDLRVFFDLAANESLELLGGIADGLGALARQARFHFGRMQRLDDFPVQLADDRCRRA